MNLRMLVISLATLLSGLASAAPTTLTFSAVTQSAVPGTGFPDVGTTIAGAVTFDYDPGQFTTYTPDAEPNYTAHQYAGAPFLWAATLGGTAFSHPYLAVEVFDNGSLTYPALWPTDTVMFSTKKGNVAYSLQLFGPNASFSGSSIPSPATLEGFWNSGILRIDDYNRAGDFNVLTARVTAVSVSAVPEPSEWLLLLTGMSLVLVRSRRRA